MLIDPPTLSIEKLEEIEKASIRLVFQAMFDFRKIAEAIFKRQSPGMKPDLAQDIAEDITRAALDRIGVSRIDDRLVGKIDYKRARYVFHPEYAVKQALLVDSKAEKGAEGVARIQVTQTSMQIRQIRSGRAMNVSGLLPTIYDTGVDKYVTTTILLNILICFRQVRTNLERLLSPRCLTGCYKIGLNPMASDAIWNAGPDSPTRKEKFRTRLSFKKLKEKCVWRVQTIQIPSTSFAWDN